MTESSPEVARRRATLPLRVGVACVWILTGVLVVSPLYRAIGATYLGRLGLPLWLMPFTCVIEIGLGAWVAFQPASELVTWLQLAMVASFTLILGLLEPRLLASPFGMLTKNLPIMACVAGAYLIEKEGFTPRARAVLRVGMALIWITEGLIPKILFQQPEELIIAARSGLAWGNPSRLLYAIGAAQLVSGILALKLSNAPLRWLLGAQIAALLILPVVVSWQVPWLWFHPFGPLTKNIPIITGTWVVFKECSSSS